MRIPSLPQRQKGSVILAILAMFMLVAGYMLMKEFNNAFVARDKISNDVLFKAKEALIGYAATYRDRQPSAGPIYDQVFGYLPCPATNGNGVVPVPPANCGITNVTQINIFPWRSLGLTALRDSSGECLRYIVSGTYKNRPLTAVMNWDTVGQLTVNDADGTVLATGVAAAIFAPRGRIANQNRNPAGNTECRTNNTVANYLEGTDPMYAGTVPAALATTTVTQSTPSSLQNGTNNDRLVWITPAEIFDRVKQRGDFKTDIDTMMTDIVTCLNALAPASLPAASAGNKGIDNVLAACPTAVPLKTNFRNNWRDNLLYARFATPLYQTTTSTTITVNSTINANPPCHALLIFGGERTGTQTRTTAIQKALATNYLEGANRTSFPAGNSYAGLNAYDKNQSSDDIVRCIVGNGSGSGTGTQVTFASDFGNFVAAGTGVTTNSGTQTVAVANSPGASGGCFWYPTALPLNGRTVRAYYEFTFGNADNHALTGAGPDHGNGFNFTLLRGDQGAPAACGTQNNMGMFNAGDSFGVISLFVETDVHQDGANSDPTENHTAIMADGNFNHPAGTMTAACNGTARGCRHSPANKFEESPSPLPHNQRVEIHTGYTDAACTIGTGGSYAKFMAWVDCAGCTDTSTDFMSSPTIVRCITLDPAMNNFYFGFTGGFRTGGPVQSVTIRNLDLRTQ